MNHLIVSHKNSVLFVTDKDPRGQSVSLIHSFFFPFYFPSAPCILFLFLSPHLHSPFTCLPPSSSLPLSSSSLLFSSPPSSSLPFFSPPSSLPFSAPSSSSLLLLPSPPCPSLPCPSPSLDPFLQEGLPMMIRLTESGYYLPCLKVLSNMFPRLLHNEKTLINNEQ